MGGGFSRIMTPLEPMHSPKVTCDELHPPAPRRPVSGLFPSAATGPSTPARSSAHLSAVRTPSSIDVPMRPLSVQYAGSTDPILEKELRQRDQQLEEEERKALSSDQRDELERQEEGQPPADTYKPFDFRDYPLFYHAFRYMRVLLYLGAVLHLFDIPPVASRIWRYSVSVRGVHQAVVDVILAVALVLMYVISIVSWFVLFRLFRDPEDNEIHRLVKVLNDSRPKITQRAFTLVCVITSLGLLAAIVGQFALFIYALYAADVVGEGEGRCGWTTDE